MATPQQRSRDNLTSRGYLVDSVERRKRFPDKKRKPCAACGEQPCIDIKADLFGFADLVAFRPVPNPDIVLVQTTSRTNHATRRNKILASMEARLCLLAGARILLQSWAQKGEGERWQVTDEWITLKDYEQAPHYPNTVHELLSIRRKAKAPDLPPGTELPFGAITDDSLPF
jgi:hypothetical protein